MRIGIDARMYSSAFTGIGRYVYELTQRLFQLDHPHPHEWILFMNDSEYGPFNPPHERVKKVRVNARHYSWKEQVTFCQQLWHERLDLMHFTHFNAPLLYRRPSVVTIHDLTLSFFPGKKMRSLFHRAAYHWVLNSVIRRSHGVIAVSQHTAEDVQKLLKVPASKVHMIYEAVGKEFRRVEAATVDAVRRTYALTNAFLLYTGVWRDHKNLPRLIEAFARLCSDAAFDGDLVITGRRDPFYPEVEATVRALGLEKRVRFTGLAPEQDLVALYSGARVYVLPSLYEGFGLSPLEAMACGTPVVASQAACIPEVCGKGNAVFFDPYDVKSIEQAIRKVWFDATLCRQLAARGLDRVKDFSWDRMATETLAFYNEVLGSL